MIVPYNQILHTSNRTQQHTDEFKKKLSKFPMFDKLNFAIQNFRRNHTLNIEKDSACVLQAINTCMTDYGKNENKIQKIISFVLEAGVSENTNLWKIIDNIRNEALRNPRLSLNLKDIPNDSKENFPIRKRENALEPLDKFYKEFLENKEKALSQSALLINSSNSNLLIDIFKFLLKEDEASLYLTKDSFELVKLCFKNIINHKEFLTILAMQKETLKSSPLFFNEIIALLEEFIKTQEENNKNKNIYIKLKSLLIQDRNNYFNKHK